MSPPVPSNITCLDNARAVSRAVRSSAVKRFPADTRRSRSAASRSWPQLTIHLIDDRAQIALDAAKPSAQLVGDRKSLVGGGDRMAAVIRGSGRHELRQQHVRQMPRLLDALRDIAQPVQQRVRLRHPVEHGIHFGDIGSDGARARQRARAGPASRSGAPSPGTSVTIRLLDLVEMLKNRIDLLACDAGGRIAERGQRALDRVRAIGDLRLLDDARRALERMGQAQQPLDRGRLARPFLEVEDALRELIHQLARLEPEVLVGILGHDPEAIR